MNEGEIKSELHATKHVNHRDENQTRTGPQVGTTD